MEDALNISLASNPTRQKFWRVVRDSAIILSIFAGIVSLHRVVFTWSSVVPNDSDITIRLPRNPQTISTLRSFTRGLNVIPGVPYSLADLLRSSNRALTVAYSPDSSVTIVLDRAITDREKAAFESFGATVTIDHSSSIITNAGTPPTLNRSIISGLYRTLTLGSSGALSTQGGTTNLELKTDSVTFSDFAALEAPSIEAPITNHTLIYSALSSNDLRGLTDRIFTQNTPGLAQLFSLGTINGLSIIAAQESGAAPAFSLALPITDSTRTAVNEDLLKQISREITEIPTIEGITNYLDDGSRTTNLRSREEATIVIRDESPYRFLNATSSQTSVNMTQTPTLLTLKSGSLDGATATTPCLSGARAFILPKTITQTITLPVSFSSQSLASLLWRANAIASTNSTTRICYTENSSL
jgi:hypothetical protein